MVTKTQEEWDSMSKEERKAHLEAEEKIVFGTDFKKKGGVPVEQGIGSPAHPTDNHVAAIIKYYDGDDKEAVVAQAKKELAAYKAKRKKAG